MSRTHRGHFSEAFREAAKAIAASLGVHPRLGEELIQGRVQDRCPNHLPLEQRLDILADTLADIFDAPPEELARELEALEAIRERELEAIRVRELEAQAHDRAVAWAKRIANPSVPVTAADAAKGILGRWVKKATPVKRAAIR